MVKEKERELVELLEAAKKAAEGAVVEEAEESRCIDALAQLKSFPVSIHSLVSTQVGKRLRSLTKHSKNNIKSLASDIFAMWKNMLLDQTRSTDKPRKHISKSTFNCQTTIVAVSTKLESPSKYNDSMRDRIRQQLCEAFSKVPSKVTEDIRDQVGACDPSLVAASIESALFQNWGQSNGSHKTKYLSFMFNVKDPNNPDFRRKLLIGQHKPEDVVNLSSEEMASDARQLENERIKAKALFECQLGGQRESVATTDEFKCERCGQRRTTYYQIQTRSADEPMTTYVTCVNCNHHWKFC